MRKTNELADKEENIENFYVVRGYPTRWKKEYDILKIDYSKKVEESNNIGCPNTTLKLINIQGLTKTKSMEVEKLMNDHTI